MGVGFAVFVPASEANKVLAAAKANGLKAIVGGRVEAGPKQVVIEPINITFKGDSLGVR